MRCAVVVIETGTVRAVIVAEPTDTPYPGTTLVGLNDDSPVAEGWQFEAGLFSAPAQEA
jgi:hypothetical protein